ncbi:MAG TPA: hypothetical protein VHS96_15770, partial [Bacteroidia bacterium]|nr:hypothetical protein [Bacteroidia bacterium]
IMNSSSNIYLVFDLNQYKYLDAIKIYKGELSSMPLDSDGQVDLENFSFQPNLSQPLNDYTLMAPLSTTPSCTDIVIWARITTRGMFGNITATNYAWVTGTPVANGYYLRYCAPACSTVSTGIGNTN